MKGIEPSQPAWKAGALPLSYTRIIYACVLAGYSLGLPTAFAQDGWQDYNNVPGTNGGGEWIRTTESVANGFTVRPLWPTRELLQIKMELVGGLEPLTY